MTEPINSWEAYTASVRAMQQWLEQRYSLAQVTAVLAEVKRQLAYLRHCENARKLIRRELWRNRKRDIPLPFMSLRELKRFHLDLRDLQADCLEEIVGTNRNRAV